MIADFIRNPSEKPAALGIRPKACRLPTRYPARRIARVDCPSAGAAVAQSVQVEFFAGRLRLSQVHKLDSLCYMRPKI
jgi:hypothetical protein